ncbi:MAG: aminotransferase class I/II-fold pyridoxal phosphate-dependent enzyme, partial [Proteobacteria bacterium]|nr:aminotransferase class I/II-fold pyridoxal phosphate-dependent enzyme [Pseudomonadota bacterium]
LDKLKRRRDLCMLKIAQIPGMSCVAPHGSFYAFVRVENVDDDTKWCKDLLETKGVVVVPGSGFDYHDPGAGYFRIVFLPDESVLAEAFDKIAEFVQETRK